MLIDRITNATVGAGMINFELRRSQNVHWQAVEVDKGAHAQLKRQRPCVVWLTGLSGAGKSTVANILEQRLHLLGRHTYLLDGDNVRHGLNKDLGFTDADRVENIRRIAEVAKLMVDAGLIVITSFISPFRSERRMARGAARRGEFLEIFIDTPLEVAERRDPKHLYAKARRGEIKNFTGIDSPYERPEAPDVRIDTTTSPRSRLWTASSRSCCNGDWCRTHEPATSPITGDAHRVVGPAERATCRQLAGPTHGSLESGSRASTRVPYPV